MNYKNHLIIPNSMKTKQLILGIVALIMAISLSFMGCRKKPSVNDSDTTGAADNALADHSFNDMHQASDEASKSNMSGYRVSENGGILSACATFTLVAHADSSGSIIVDFGTTNCLCH